MAKHLQRTWMLYRYLPKLKGHAVPNEAMICHPLMNLSPKRWQQLFIMRGGAERYHYHQASLDKIQKHMTFGQATKTKARWRKRLLIQIREKTLQPQLSIITTIIITTIKTQIHTLRANISNSYLHLHWTNNSNLWSKNRIIIWTVILAEITGTKTKLLLVKWKNKSICWMWKQWYRVMPWKIN